MNKNQNITIINGSELLSKLEQPLDELRTGVRNLQAEVRRKEDNGQVLYHIRSLRHSACLTKFYK